MAPSAAALAAELVRLPSPSGAEGAAAAHLAAWARAAGLAAAVDDTAVCITVPGRRPGPLLLLVSHLDTVPPGEGWTVDPFAGIVREGWLLGRGAVDAKAAVAAMAAAAAAVAAAGGPARGELAVLASFREETRDPTLPLALARLPRPPAAAIVGEPTGLAPAVAERGLLALDLLWRGEQLHAGWASALPEPPANAILAAARDLLALAGLPLERCHPVLGRVAITPTRIEAGVARNATPPACRAVLDVRTTPSYGHEELAALIRSTVSATVEVVSARRRPRETPPGSALLAAVLAAGPAGPAFGSPTTSDWVWLEGVDAVKLGPGDSRLSHTAGEQIRLEEIEAGAALYAAAVREYLR